MTKLNDGTLLGTLKDENYSGLKERVDSIVADKIHSKITTKKEEFLDKVTGR